MIAESLRFVYNCVHFTAANLLFTMNNAEQKGRGLFLVVVMEFGGEVMLKGRRGSCIWKCLGEDRSQKCFLIRCVLGGGPKNVSKSTLSSFDSI